MGDLASIILLECVDLKIASPMKTFQFRFLINRFVGLEIKRSFQLRFGRVVSLYRELLRK